MRDFSTPRTFILSAYLGKDATKDRAQHCELACDLALEGIPFRECEGSYKQQYEQAFIVVGVENQRAVRELARHYGQETYLCIAENDRTAYLVDCSTNYHTHLGKFHAVGEDEPDAGEGLGWTLLDGVFFTTDGAPGVDLPEGF